MNLPLLKWIRILLEDRTSGVGPIALRAGCQSASSSEMATEAMIAVDSTARENFLRWEAKCVNCGFDLVLVPVEQLIEGQFESQGEGAEMLAFTTRCAMCQQTMVKARSHPQSLEELLANMGSAPAHGMDAPKKKWWQFW